MPLRIRKTNHAIALVATLAAVTVLSGCASGPPLPASGLGTLWGRLELAPPEGLPATTGGAGQYGDPRLRDARRFDHERPGFAVVYLEDRGAPSDALTLEIRSTRTGARLSPELGVIGISGVLTIENQTDRARIISVPELALLHSIDAGSSVAIETLKAGETAFHLLGEESATATLFVSPGAYARCNEQGGWVLENQTPGPAQLHAWHHRYPPTEVSVEILEGEVREVLLRSSVTSPAHSSTVNP